MMMFFRKLIGTWHKYAQYFPNKYTSPTRNQKGFSLIEAMIGMTIFTIGVLGIGAMLVYSTRARVVNRMLDYAVELGHTKLEELRKVATREIDIRYSAVLNFNYVLSRDPNYGTTGGFHLPGLLSGASGYNAAEADLSSKATGGEITEDDKQKKLDEIMVMYDDGDFANHGDATASDGIWSSRELINMETLIIKTPERFNAMTQSEQDEWGWTITRITTLEPIELIKVTGSDYERDITHATLAADPADTTGADLAEITVKCSFFDMTDTERDVLFETIVARSSM